MKQVIIVRTDLKMGKGKIAAQCSHASVKAVEASAEEDLHQWEQEGSKKVVLKVSSERELVELFQNAKDAKLIAKIIRDAGHTQIEAGSITTLAIGPAKDIKIDFIAGKLKLL
jgi:peptidyl-tRNA hydrolase, PTH2 family